MKNILSVIVVILLFVVSGLIFWAALSPETFFKFFETYPVVNKTANQIGVLKQIDSSLLASSSEPVLGLSGQIIVRNNTWNVEIASNENDRAQGLSNRKTLYNNRGMLFVFDKMTFQSFWMKDMLIPIDIIFFDSNWRIVLIESNVESNTFPKTFGSSVKSQYILEVNALEAAAYGLQVGDQAIFLNK
jgi:uncharacterized membrane protein (UPF0127 family)